MVVTFAFETGISVALRIINEQKQNIEKKVFRGYFHNTKMRRFTKILPLEIGCRNEIR
jgi:hypothetical protein